MSRDMSLPYDWTPTTSSEDTWTTTSAPVERNTMPYETSLWPTSGYAAYQDLPSSDDAAWYPAVHGSVVGLSPVLSQMSQNSHTLHFFPELDTFPTGHKVDHFPLPSEAHQWNLSDGLALGSFLTPDACSSLSQGLPSSETTFPDLSVDSPALCAVQQPLLLFPDGQSCESRRSFSEPNVGHGRRLLPRTPQALPMSRSQSSSQYRAIQPHSVVASSTFAETEGNIPVLPKAPASRGATLSEPLAASVCRPTATSEVAYAQDQLSGPEVSSAINSGLPAVYLQTADFEDYRYHGEFDQTCAQPTR
ncbi:uncharacterized protein K489DRAFT_266981 [Dissoconium aciculare CBS 342.82]|uniref:Uncharacterized protein n=1 Tax=Dissoconium aciculare CBS 342.82 TaxID=1314786 RepID=A0A6J3M0V8_9PEZI|nr:uncharacterized protein K489DRAFT_266981 [Dissoconium aciculare CBS 342.82]KAF1821139.1 hypothetical protein K489DRAFT_266981 [Dissoconium aciculare CBS 342.82]